MQDDFKKNADAETPKEDKSTNEGGIVRFSPTPFLRPPGPDQLR